MENKTLVDYIRIVGAYVMGLIAVAIGILPFVRETLGIDPTLALLTVVGVLLTYLVGRTERNITELVGLRAAVRAHSDVEVFHSVQQWAARLLDESRHSDSVRTQMFSNPPKDASDPMAEYFKHIHACVLQRRLPFQRLATLCDPRKVAWLFDVLYELKDAPSFSLGVIDIDHRKFPLNSFQICQRGEEFATFVFSSNVISPGVHTCLIRDRNFGRVAEQTFERFWDASVKLKLGEYFDVDRIAAIAAQFKLLDSPAYVRLRNAIET